MLSSSLKSREDACAVLARSLVEDLDALMSDGETKAVCSSWSLVVKGVPVVECRPDGTSQLVILWLHPSNLHLCFGKKKLFRSAGHGMHLAHLLAVRADDGPLSAGATPSRPTSHASAAQYYLSFESFAGDVVVIAMPTQSARDNLLHTFQDVLKVIDVMATVQDHVELYLRTNTPSHYTKADYQQLKLPDQNEQFADDSSNQTTSSPVKSQQLCQPTASDEPETDTSTDTTAQTSLASQPGSKRKTDWTPADLDAWLYARQLSPLFVPLHAYLSDAYARGDAKATFFRLTPEIVDRIVCNQNQTSVSSSVVQLRQSLLHHVAKGRRASSTVLPRRLSTFRLY